MKLTLLAKQLRLLKQGGVSSAEVRLGYHAETVTMQIDVAMREITRWNRAAGRIGDGEISVKPCLPRCWQDEGQGQGGKK